MSTETNPNTVPALAFVLGGAPDTPHVINSEHVRGIFHPSYPRPVGEGTGISREDASACSEQPGTPLELVTITRQEAAQHQAALDELEAVVKRGVRSSVEQVRARPATSAIERKRVRREEGHAVDQLDALNPNHPRGN